MAYRYTSSDATKLAALRRQAESHRAQAGRIDDRELSLGYIAKAAELDRQADDIELGHAPPEPKAEDKAKAQDYLRKADAVWKHDRALADGYAAIARKLLEPGKD